MGKKYKPMEILGSIEPIEQHQPEPPAPVPPVHSIFEDFSTEDNEYECGSACTADGCMGHDGGVPCYIYVGGESLVAAGHEGGDFPDETATRYIEVIGKIETAASIFKPALDLIQEFLCDQETLSAEIRNEALCEKARDILTKAEVQL